ncbi:putative Chromo domain-containing protein [Seiridium unicorne]|uniref:Chromo domain-containing protein n=1 Tax=Seiridium unicorne TaxID=138068 RepID=A0ABR2UUH6_9PEZI
MTSTADRKHVTTKRIRKSSKSRRVSNITDVQRQSLRIAIRDSLRTAQQNAVDSTGTTSDAIISEDSPVRQDRKVDFDRKQFSAGKSSQDSQGPSDHSCGIPAGRPGWYQIRGISAQRLGYYLVEWKGLDPITGKEWPADFVHHSNINGAALQEWHSLRNAGKLKRDQYGTLVREEAAPAQYYEDAWQRSIRQACRDA